MTYINAMATMTHPVLLTAEQFLEIDFGPDKKAELDNGIIRMMAGGTGAHARTAGNIFAFLRTALRGSGCRPFNSDMAVQTHRGSVRYPDVAVYCEEGGPDSDLLKAFNAPSVIFEVLSDGTARTDLGIKLDEYKALASVQTVVFVDATTERVRIVQRTSPAGWNDVSMAQPHDVDLPSLGITIPHSEIFARD